MPSILPQLIINGLIAGSIYALAAAGFALVYYVVKFQYFSHGAMIAAGAYFFFLFANVLGLSFAIAGILAIACTIIITLAVNYLVYLPLRKRKATSNVMLITSVVLLMFFSSLILALFGSSTKTLVLGSEGQIFDFGLFTITSLQAYIIFFAIALFFVLYLIMKKTRIGKAMRALADNKSVAQVVGINPERVYTYVFIISGAFAAVSGILIGLEQNLYPKMGVIIIIKGFISSVVGGLGSVPGSVIGGFFIGLIENVGVWYLPTGYKDLISFSVMILFLLLRPQGILGVKLRDDT
ncbi:branched-chain amino acid ABC transporter permease [Candidatus Woesearchaeota archaeon]|nr:branched-chain amino acid ABC transporter permease [Candidatus Woesearchaeota archaeon]